MNYVPEVLVNSIMKRAPMCNGILNCALASSPPPPQVGFALALGLVLVDVALSKTCLASNNELLRIGSFNESKMCSVRIIILSSS